MDTFTYVMVLVSIVVGLGITPILCAVGAAIHRSRGYGPSAHRRPHFNGHALGRSACP